MILRKWNWKKYWWLYIITLCFSALPYLLILLFLLFTIQENEWYLWWAFISGSVLFIVVTQIIPYVYKHKELKDKINEYKFKEKYKNVKEN